MSNETYTATIEYRNLGLINHPLSSPTDKNKSPGKRPLIKDWQNIDMPTEEQLKEWFLATNNNIGLQCGARSNVTLLDFDHMLFYEDVFMGVNITTRSSGRTAGRGHVYFKFQPMLLSQKHHDLGIEVLSNGSNAVMPPSVHASGDVYKWQNPEAPIIDMPETVVKNLNKLFRTEAELKQIIAKCRHCFRDVIKRKPDMHGAEGREYMIAVCTDIKAVRDEIGGKLATEEHIKMFAKLMYGKDYNEKRTLEEWKNIDASKTWKCDTLKAKLPAYVDCEKCEERKTEAQETTEYEPEPLEEQTEPIQERKINIDLPENHFISQYLKWGESVTDAYREYHIVNALWLLSAATMRKVVLKLRQEYIRPNLWIQTLGNSTTSHKSTAVNKARTMFEKASDTSLPNDAFSFEGYLESLSETPIMNNVVDEASSLLAKYHQRYNDGVFEFECSVYDGSPEVLQKRLSSGKAKTPKTYTIKDYYVTKLYATTPDKLAHCMAIDDFLSGYGYRWIYNYPKYKHDRKPLEIEKPEDVKAWTQILGRIRDFCNLFKQSNEVCFTASDDVMKFYDSICVEMENRAAEQNNDVLDSIIGRSGIHILKIAMLLELGKNPVSTNLTMESIKIASEMVTDYFIPSIMEIIDRLQEDIKNNYIEKIIAILRRLGGTASHTKLLRDSNMKSKDFIECICTMIESRRIKIEQDKPRVYKLINHNTPLNLRSVREVRNVRLYNEGNGNLTKITKTASIDACTPSTPLLRTNELYERYEQNEPIQERIDINTPDSQQPVINQEPSNILLDFGVRAKDWSTMHDGEPITNQNKVAVSMWIAETTKHEPSEVMRYLEKEYKLTPGA